MNYLVDSDTVADWLNEQPAAVGLLTCLVSDGLAISIITHSETMEGILGGRDPRKARSAFLAFLQGVRILPNMQYSGLSGHPPPQSSQSASGHAVTAPPTSASA